MFYYLKLSNFSLNFVIFKKWLYYKENNLKYPTFIHFSILQQLCKSRETETIPFITDGKTETQWDYNVMLLDQAMSFWS